MTGQIHGGDVWSQKKRPIDFSANINPLGPPEAVKDVLGSWKMEYYPPADPIQLKKRIAEKLGVKAENITTGNGSIEILKDFLAQFLERGKALILEPTFSEYHRLTTGFKGNTHRLLPDRGLEHSKSSIMSMISPDTRMIFLCRPNNPTGHSLSRDIVHDLLDYCEEKGVFLFLDEAFIEFSDDESLTPLVREYDRLFVLRSFTKFYAIPGLRAGYGVGSPEVIRRLEEIKTPWNLNIYAHDAVIACLDEKDYAKRSRDLIKTEKRYLEHEISSLGIKVYPSKANFLLLRYNWNSRDVMSNLLKKGILIRECSNFYGLDTRYIRVCVRGRVENQELIKALGEEVKKGIKKGAECAYYPCHFQGQDCTFCYCPIYPCAEEDLGTWIIGKRGTRVWSCKGCQATHRRDAVKEIKVALGGNIDEPLDSGDREKFFDIIKRQSWHSQ